MPEYDAFGREIGENTLAGLGGDSGAGPAPRAEPADGWAESTARAEPDVQAEPATRAAPERPRMTLSLPEGARSTVMPGAARRRGRGLGCLIALVVASLFLVGPVIALVTFVGSAGDVIDDVTDAVDELPGTLTPPTGITGDSMLAPDNLAGGLQAVRGAGFTRATQVDARPARLSVTVVKAGRERDVVVSPAGDLTRGPARRSSASSTFALAALDPAAPARLVRGAAKRYRVRPKGINYVLAGPEPEGHHWRAYFKNGTYVEGDATGRVIRRFDGG